MRALADEHKTCVDASVEPDSFVVIAGKVQAEVARDKRRIRGGVRIGSL